MCSSGSQPNELVAVARIGIPVAVQVGHHHCHAGIERPEAWVGFASLNGIRPLLTRTPGPHEYVPRRCTGAVRALPQRHIGSQAIG